MDKTLVEAIAQAAWNNREQLRNHLKRNDKTNTPVIPQGKNKSHYFIEEFQEGVLNSLKNSKSIKGYNWDSEVRNADVDVEDRVDIMGERENGRNCIIEIDAVRHDQIAPKFVSRIALWGLGQEPLDYVILLYDSTQKSGKHSAEKFVRYTYAILKAINKESSLIAIYVHTPKNGSAGDSLEYWDCEKQGFSIKEENNSKTYTSMIDCEEAAIKYFLEKKKPISYEELRETFEPNKNKKFSYVSNTKGKSREKKTNLEIEDHTIYIYSQFRKTGNQRNWNKFVEICKKNGITIEQSFSQGKYKQPQ